MQLTAEEVKALEAPYPPHPVRGTCTTARPAPPDDPNAQLAYDRLEEAWKAWNKSQGQVMQG